MVIDEIYGEYGVRPIALGVHKDNHNAARFYECHGFSSQVRTIVHTLVAVAAALVGIFKASRFGSAQPDAGSGSELIIMAAVIIGGCGVEGGNGSVLGSFFGCLLMF